MRSLTVPKFRDPRWLLLAFFAVLLTYVLGEPGFARTPAHLLLSVGVCCSLDTLLAWLQRGKLLFPMSGLISSLGTFILVDSPLLWATGLAGALAILSKYLLRVNGRHLFNPNNFGVVVCCLAFPDFIVSGAFRWGGKPALSLLLFAVGWALVVRAQRWLVSLSYLVSFLGFNLARALFFQKPLWAYSLSMLGPGMQLFLFYMISDPRTSPDDRKRQLAFGVMLGLVDNLFRQLEWRDSPLLACFVVCGAYNLYRAYRPDTRAFTVWQTTELAYAPSRRVAPRD